MAEVKSRIIENFGFYHFTKKNLYLLQHITLSDPVKDRLKNC